MKISRSLRHVSALSMLFALSACGVAAQGGDDGAANDTHDTLAVSATSGHTYGETSNAAQMNAAATRMPGGDMSIRSLDYRNYNGHNYVPPVRDQGGCGSCWAFASVGVYESKYLLATGQSVDLSEQQLIGQSPGNCGGGSSDALKFWSLAGPGPLDESCTGYSGTNTPNVPLNTCAQKPTRLVDTDYYTVDANQPEEVKKSLLADGPAYFRFDVYQEFDTFWGTAKAGAVFTQAATAANKLGGHAVLLIGWDDSKAAWLLKNSWGVGGPNGDGTFWMAMSGHTKDIALGVANTKLSAFRDGYSTAWGGTFNGAKGNLLGDVTGDGNADLVGLGSNYVGVLRSNGSAFGAYETWWNGGFYGSHGTLLGDVTGDGKADLVGMGDGYVGVIRSTGNAFGAYETWWSNSFYGSHGTFLADVDNNGKADLVGIGDGYVGVIRSTGNGFGSYETWLGANAFGTRGTLVADVTGDHKADIVMLGDNNITIRRSTGSGFGPVETWWSGPFYGSHGTLLSDVTGDGKADLVGMGDGYVGVLTSNGAQFGKYETLWGASFYGSYGTFLGDMNHDGRAELVGLGQGYVGALLPAN